MQTVREDGFTRAGMLGSTALMLLLCAPAAHAAATPEQTCQAGKTDAAGRYSACVGKAEKGLALGGDPAKYAALILKCQEKLAGAYDKAEATAVNKGGACPSVDDVDAVQDLLDGCTAGVIEGVSGGSLPQDPQACDADLAECEARPAAQPLTTGQTACYDTAGTLIPCAGTGQDAETQNGVVRNFVDNGDGTITDLATGLMWEKKSDDGTIHDMHTGYTWAAAFTRIATLNSSEFAGYSDWRLPNVRELQTLVNLGAVTPAAYGAFNNNCVFGCSVTTCSCTLSAMYWTSSTMVAGNNSSAWLVSFYYGGTSDSNKTNANAVRAVRGGS